MHSSLSEADVQAKLRPLNASPTIPVMRSTCLNVAEIKRLLDVGAQTLVIPYVQTVKKAELTAAAEDYPSAGIRGVSGGPRCSKYGSVPGYFENALFAFRIGVLYFT